MRVQKAITFRASSIGDCLMGKYFLENIHAEFPHAHCAIVVGSRSAMIRDLMAGYPWLEVVEANRRNPFSVLRLWRQWRESDVVLTQYAGKTGGHFDLGSKLVARLLARRGGLIGFVDAARINDYLYDKLIPFSLDTAPAELERRALCAVGLEVRLSTPTLTSTPSRAVARELSQPYIVVHLFAGNRGRGLHPDKKRELLNALVRMLPQTLIVVTGGKEDREEALALVNNLPVSVVAGETSLQELMNLMRGSRHVISVDTGVAHIAAQLQIPLVVLATCLGLHWWGRGQYGEHAPIQLFSHQESNRHIFKEYPSCINDIDMGAVVHAVL